MTDFSQQDHPRPPGPVLEIFLAFLRLGLLSFGGPIAHLGYFHEAFVKRRRWLSEATYADLIALSQMLPGPSSSQVGFALGLIRGGGLAGGVAAWLGFTMPTVLILIAFAYGASSLREPWQLGLLHGLKLVAVAVVAHAIWGMARPLGWNWRPIAIALAAGVVAAAIEDSWVQIVVIALSAAAGLALMRADAAAGDVHAAPPVSRQHAVGALAVFALLFLGLPLLAAATQWQAVRLIDGFFRTGSLVFGGGHVVLPLLQEVMVAPGWVGAGDFVAGYGATQAMPGPIFSFAAFLGAISAPAPNGVTGGLIAVAAIFLPGLLLMYGALPFWQELKRIAAVRAAMHGVNAAVVGLLAAAFYRPLWTSTIGGPLDILLALAGFAALLVWRRPAWMVVVGLGGAGVARALLGFG